MTRVPLPTRESVPEDQRSIFDELTKMPGGVHTTGPSSILLHVPKIRHWEKGLNDYLRHESSLAKKMQELAMLITARELDCQYIWNAHVAAARAAGVSSALVDALRDRSELPVLAKEEAVVIHYGREILRAHRVSRGMYEAAIELFGQRGVIELSMIFGSYSSLSYLLNAFDADLPATRTEPVLPVEPSHPL